GRAERLPRPVDWCVASPDQATIVTGDRIGYFSGVPSIRCWDSKSGTRRHLIDIPEALGHPVYMHEWYARWLDNSRLLIVRLLRYNPARSASPRLILVDIASGKVVKVSEEFDALGEHVFLSPDQKMAVVKHNNSTYRKGNGGLVTHYCYSATHVVDLDSFTV